MTQSFGAPCVRDIAIQLMRIARFCGSGEKWWPVGLHSMAVAELVRRRALKLFAVSDLRVIAYLVALLHDAEEAVVNDVPRPMKTSEQKTLGDEVRTRIFEALGITPYPREIDDLVKQCDLEICCAEAYFGFGPRGFAQTQTNYQELLTAEALAVMENWKNFELADCIYLRGDRVAAFENEILVALRNYHKIDYTVAA